MRGDGSGGSGVEMRHHGDDGDSIQRSAAAAAAELPALCYVTTVGQLRIDSN